MSEVCGIELTKEFIEKLKKDDKKEITRVLKKCEVAVTSLLFVLKSLGHLPKDFDFSVFVPYLKFDNDKVRYWAVKNIGKSKSEKFSRRLIKQSEIEHSTMVKREIVSAIGRMKSKKNIRFLINMLQDNDPKVITQAIRGLLAFKGDCKIDEVLKALINHQNESIQDIIAREYYPKEYDCIQRQPHIHVNNNMRNVIINADVREVLNIIPDDTIHLTFTSPPYYNARDYSIYPSYAAYLDFLEAVFRETYRVTKEGRFLIVNTSPVIVPRASRAHSSKRYPIPFDLHTRLVNIGWEFIDDIIWLKPEYSVKNRVGGFQQHRKPLAYKPNCITEYLMVYRKKTDKLLDWNIKQYEDQIVESSKVKEDFDTTNVWGICPASSKVHSAVFPEELCARVIKYYSYIGDLVFDPFAGIGTFGRVARNMQRNFFMTEQEREFFEYMRTLGEETGRGFGEQTRFLSFEEFRGAISNDGERTDN